MGSFVHKKFLCSIKSNTSEGKREPGAQGWARSLVLDTDASMLWPILLGAWVTLQRHPSLLTEAGSQALLAPAQTYQGFLTTVSTWPATR